MLPSTYLQPPAPSRLPVDASDLPIRSGGAMAQRDQRGMTTVRAPRILTRAPQLDSAVIKNKPGRSGRGRFGSVPINAIPPNRLMRQCRPHGAEPDQESRMVLKIERFQPEGMNVRMSGGKPSYSHVVTVSGSGKIVYTAGRLARDIDGNCVGKGDMRAQMEQTFQNLDRCLKAAGATWADVVKTNTFVTDFDEFQKCADIRMHYLGVATPTSTTVGVTRLAGPDFMIEIEAVAVVNS